MQQRSFLSSVTGTGGETPTGMVKLMKGMDVLGAAWLSNGAASIPNLQLGVGTYVLTASYEGDSTHAERRLRRHSARWLKQRGVYSNSPPATATPDTHCVLAAVDLGGSRVNALPRASVKGGHFL